jgi:DNA-binding CsgD family transcriptional regulator
MTNRQIAAQLRISVHGVKFHLTAIYRKLGVENRTAATARFLAGPPRAEDVGEN